MSWEAIAAFIALGLTIITSLVLVMRGLWRIENNMRKYFDDKQKEARIAIKEDINESRNMFGESVKAAKEHADIAHHKIDALLIRHQNLELYIRDKYVEIDSFNVAFMRIEKAFDVMDQKIDTLMSRGH